MSVWGDRVIADALGRASDLLAAERDRGELRWSVNGLRCYGKQAPDAYRLTLVGSSGPELRYEFVGVNGEEV